LQFEQLHTKLQVNIDLIEEIYKFEFLCHTPTKEGQSFKLKVGYDGSRYLTVRIDTVSTEAQRTTPIQQDGNNCLVMFEEIFICEGDN